MNTMKKTGLWLLVVVVATVGLAAIGLGGELEPTGPPGSTMKTLDQIPPTWSQKITDASKRFEIVLDGAAVLDKETGLVWERSPDTTQRTWSNAISYAYKKVVGGRKGWRLPTVEELATLVDSTLTNPALPSGHPFANVQSWQYWSSTTHDNYADFAWTVRFNDGVVEWYNKTTMTFYVWSVRGGSGVVGY